MTAQQRVQRDSARHFEGRTFPTQDKPWALEMNAET
jgi:hypothetical protein